MTSGTALALCSLEFISKIAFSLVVTWMAMCEEMMVVNMRIWDLVQEMLKVRGFLEFGDAVSMEVCNIFFRKED